MTPNWRSQAEIERAERELDRRTVDRVFTGDDASESAHHLKGDAHGLGTRVRQALAAHASDGWFSYEVKVVPDRPQILVCTYWGLDSGPRTFDILVNGRQIATQSLKGDHPAGILRRPPRSAARSYSRQVDDHCAAFSPTPGISPAGCSACGSSAGSENSKSPARREPRDKQGRCQKTRSTADDMTFLSEKSTCKKAVPALTVLRLSLPSRQTGCLS